MARADQPYRVLAVAPNRAVERVSQKAPTTDWMVSFGDNYSAAFVVRYYPTYKAWRVLDIRKRRKRTLFTGKSVWDSRSASLLPKLLPTEDAAVMWAMSLLANTDV